MRRTRVKHATSTHPLAPNLLARDIIKRRNIPHVLPAHSELTVLRVRVQDTVGRRQRHHSRHNRQIPHQLAALVRIHPHAGHAGSNLREVVIAAVDIIFADIEEGGGVVAVGDHGAVRRTVKVRRQRRLVEARAGGEERDGADEARFLAFGHGGSLAVDVEVDLRVGVIRDGDVLLSEEARCRAGAAGEAARLDTAAGEVRLVPGRDHAASIGGIRSESVKVTPGVGVVFRAGGTRDDVDVLPVDGHAVLDDLAFQGGAEDCAIRLDVAYGSGVGPLEADERYGRGDEPEVLVFRVPRHGDDGARGETRRDVDLADLGEGRGRAGAEALNFHDEAFDGGHDDVVVDDLPVVRDGCTPLGSGPLDQDVHGLRVQRREAKADGRLGGDAFHCDEEARAVLPEHVACLHGG